MNESWKIMKSKKENTEQHGTEGLWPTQTSEISRVLLQTCKRTMNPTDPKVHFLIFSQELQISGEMWPYLKCMPGMNAWRFAIFTCRRHRQSLELRRTLPESRETNDVSLYAWFFSDHGWPWCLPWCSIPWFGKNAILFAHAAAAGIGWNNGAVRCQTVWRRLDLRVRSQTSVIRLTDSLFLSWDVIWQPPVTCCIWSILVPEVSACEFVLNDGGPHYRWDKVTVSAGSIESTTVLLRAIVPSWFL